jgi:hypothetical protein
MWKRRLIMIFVAGLFALPAHWPTEAEARRGRGFSRSIGRRAPMGRSSWGSSRRSGYRRKGGLFGAKRGRRGGAMRSARRPTFNKRGHRMLGRSSANAKVRSSRATTHRQRYTAPRTRFNRRYYGGPAWGGYGWGMYRVGMWDLFFLSTVNHLFWYHHWQDRDIQQALYKEQLLDKAELTKLEVRVKELEAQGVPRDPNYLPEDVDPDLAHSKTYVEANQGEFYADNDPSQESGMGFWSLLMLAFIGMTVYSSFVRRY